MAKYDVVYESNGKPAGDRLGIVRISENGQRLELLVDPRSTPPRFVALKLRPVAGSEEPAPDPDPAPDPEPTPEPDPAPTPDPEPDPDPVPDPDPGQDVYAVGPQDPGPLPDEVALYVSPSGRANAAGTRDDPKSPEAINSHPLRAGDTVVFLAGEYWGIYPEQGGTREKPIVYRSHPQHAAKITRSGWNGIEPNADGMVFDGFEIAGLPGKGVSIEVRAFITVRNCHIHHCQQSGIQANGADFIECWHNEIHNCASNDWFSGISLWNNWDLRRLPDDGTFRNKIVGNHCHHNVTETGRHTDGNGIIIDDFQHTQETNGRVPSGEPSYAFRTLVQGNVCAFNGGKGVQILWSDNVTVALNVSYRDGQDRKYLDQWRGGISNSIANRNRFLQNVSEADDSVNVNGNRNHALLNTSIGGPNRDVAWDGNIAYGDRLVRLDGGNAIPAADNQLGEKPRYVDEPGGDYRIAGWVEAFERLRIA